MRLHMSILLPQRFFAFVFVELIVFKDALNLPHTQRAGGLTLNLVRGGVPAAEGVYVPHCSMATRCEEGESDVIDLVFLRHATPSGEGVHEVGVQEHCRAQNLKRAGDRCNGGAGDTEDVRLALLAAIHTCGHLSAGGHAHLVHQREEADKV